MSAALAATPAVVGSQVLGEGRPNPRPRLGGVALLAPALLTMGLLACASVRGRDAIRALPTGRCLPSFPYTGGWYGGDGAFSVPLPGSAEQQSLWLFGDSFVGAPGLPDRRETHLVHNSIAVSRCLPGGRWEIEYSWGRDSGGRARAFFDTGREESFWWLFDGFVHDGTLYVGLLDVTRSEPRGPLSLPFRFTGVELARIANYLADPAEWQVSVQRLSTHPVFFPAAAMVTSGPHVYFFAFGDDKGERHPRILSRLELRALESPDVDLSAELQFLARDGSWKTGLDPADARVIMSDDASEMSVYYEPDLGVWLAVYGRLPRSDTVLVRTAERLEGPWSDPVPLFHIPELDRSSTALDRDRFCYAAKAHEQFRAAGRVLLTYVCNLLTPPGGDPLAVLKRLHVELTLYRPRVVVVELPDELRAQPD